jgi:thiol-disulfide isomerase/thioredoxin
MAEGYIKDGHFTLTGEIDEPLPGMLTTNNLELVEKNGWPNDSIRWTYTDIFLSAGNLEVKPVGRDSVGTLVLQMSGTQVQSDFDDLQNLGGERGGQLWQFIESHPQSPISTWLACNMLKRAYNLTAEQLDKLENTVKPSEANSKRYEKYLEQLNAYRTTVKNAPLTDLELRDTDGYVCHLTEVVPTGKYVLIDFWASWCGICLYSMPEVAQIAEDFEENLCVVGVSIDTDEEAWKRALKKHPEPWPQYITTKQGYDDLFTKYQVGNGVPYYLLISPEGKVVLSPERPEDARIFLESELKK